MKQQGLQSTAAKPRRPLVSQLLAHAATGEPLGRSSRRFAFGHGHADLRQFRWAMAGGLGPLLHRAMCSDTGSDTEPLPPAWREALLSADLTARVRHGNSVQAALEVICACERLQVPVTLLKGISISEQFYPEEHLRPMSDIDVLIPTRAYASVEAALLDVGYDKLDHPAIAGQHHGAPLHDRRSDTVVELHTALFPLDSPFSADRAFGPWGLSQHVIASQYHGRAVQRLSPELQLAYIASSWLNDLTLRSMHPSFIASLFDAVYLLASAGPALDWSSVLDAPDTDMVTACLYTMVAYLPRFGAAPAAPAVLATLASRQSLVGALQLRLMHAMLDRHLIGGRPWRLPLPPPVPGRYSLRRQLDKRILRRLQAS